MPDERGYSALVQNDVTSALVKAMLGMKADEAPKFLDVGKVKGVVEVGRRMEPDLRYPSGLQPWAFSTTVTAGGAGQNATAAVIGVAGFLTVVEGATMLGPVASTGQFFLTTNLLGGGAPGGFKTDPRDLRPLAGTTPPFSPAPNFVSVNQAGVTPPAGSGRIYKSSAVTAELHRLPYPVVLPPGYVLLFILSDDDAGLDSNFWGYTLPL